jgi:hypothetical protein
MSETRTSNSNGQSRKTLASQIDRLDSILVMAAELERLNRAWSPRYHSSG